MLTAHHLSKTYGIQTVLHDVSFSLNPGERTGLIGPNGCGKTTLLRLLAGLEPPDAGAVTRAPASLRLGYLPQGHTPPPDLTVAAALRQAAGDPQAGEAEVARLAAALTSQPADRALQAAYDAALADLERLAAGDNGRAQQILSQFDLAGLPGDLPVAALSGGQKTRLALAALLIAAPQVLLLDEPTNHLDIAMLEWLEDWLAQFPGAALIVSHDRALLDHTANRILDLDPHTHGLRSYPGNYSAYVAQVQAERQRQGAAYADQQAEIRRLRQDIARTKEQALWVEKTTTSRQPTVRRYAKKVAAKAKSREKKLERFLNSPDLLDKPKEDWRLKLDFAGAAAGKDVLRLEGLAVGYPGHAPLLRDLNLTLRLGERAALTGANGCGKTTLLRTIAGRLAPAAGSLRLGAGVQVGYMAQEQEVLDPALSAVETIQRLAAMNATQARHFLHFYLFSGDDALRPAAELSFGERARLMLASLVVQGCNFLLLDEPVNHLDIPSRQRFEQALNAFDGAVLAVVHDRYFIERFATRLLVAEDAALREVF